MITFEDLNRRFECTPDKFDNWRFMDNETGPLAVIKMAISRFVQFIGAD